MNTPAPAQPPSAMLSTAENPPAPLAPVPHAGLSVAARHLREILDQFDPTSLIPELTGNPANYTRVVLALVKLGEWEIAHDRYRTEVAERKAGIQAALDRAKNGGGLDTDLIDAIEHELSLF
jgi:hypothetical protein